MFLIVGLGNPGPKYMYSRHNVGFMAIHKLADDFKINTTTTKFKAIIAKGIIAGEKVILAQPLTYMNNSGEAVRLIADYFNIETRNTIIIYDDLDLPLGKVRIKGNGSPGGHNGMRSIINILGTQQIPRIRIGIDSPPEAYSVIDYVLGRFSKDEMEIIDNTLGEMHFIIEEIISSGYQIAMSKFN